MPCRGRQEEAGPCRLPLRSGRCVGVPWVPLPIAPLRPRSSRCAAPRSSAAPGRAHPAPAARPGGGSADDVTVYKQQRSGQPSCFLPSHVGQELLTRSKILCALCCTPERAQDIKDPALNLGSREQFESLCARSLCVACLCSPWGSQAPQSCSAQRWEQDGCAPLLAVTACREEEKELV